MNAWTIQMICASETFWAGMQDLNLSMDTNPLIKMFQTGNQPYCTLYDNFLNTLFNLGILYLQQTNQSLL